MQGFYCLSNWQTGCPNYIRLPLNTLWCPANSLRREYEHLSITMSRLCDTSLSSLETTDDIPCRLFYGPSETTPVSKHWKQTSLWHRGLKVNLWISTPNKLDWFACWKNEMWKNRLADAMKSKKPTHANFSYIWKTLILNTIILIILSFSAQRSICTYIFCLCSPP